MSTTKPTMWYPGINRFHPLLADIKVAFLFQEGAGLRVNDVVNGNFGTINTASDFSANDWSGGERGIVLEPPGQSSTDHELTLDRAISFEAQERYTIAVGVKAFNFGANPGFYRNNNYFIVIQNGDGNVWARHNGTNSPAAGDGPAIGTDRVHDIALTWDGVNVRLYFDGRLNNTTAISTGSAWEIPELFRQSNDGIHAKIDYFYAWGRALSSTEIARLVGDPFAPFRRQKRTVFFLGPAVVTMSATINDSDSTGLPSLSSRQNIIASIVERDIIGTAALRGTARAVSTVTDDDTLGPVDVSVTALVVATVTDDDTVSPADLRRFTLATATVTDDDTLGPVDVSVTALVVATITDDDTLSPVGVSVNSTIVSTIEDDDARTGTITISVESGLVSTINEGTVATDTISSGFIAG